MTETQLQSAILDLARTCGYLAYHTHDSRRSQPGFPDLALVHKATGAVIFAELKSDKGRLTRAQREWLEALRLRSNVYLWRPAHWHDQTIPRILLAHSRKGPQ
jgi:hypothetical protein